MNDKERYDIAARLDTLTIEQKKDFLSFLQALQAQEQQHSASADTDTTTTQASPSTNAAPKPAEQAHKPSTQPRTLEEARQRIQFINLDESMTEAAHAYRAAIMQWVNENEPQTPGRYITFALAYAAGLQEGKRQERQRRRNRQSKPET